MLADLLGSKLRAKLLGWLFTHPDERYFVRQLTGLLGEDSTNISRELARLENLGILVCTREGRQKYYQAKRECAVFSELRGLAIKTTGMADVLREALAQIAEHVTAAFVYGSMAGGEITATSDIDLLVVGDLDEIELHKSLSHAEEKLGRPVNYHLFSSREFEQRRREKNGFLDRVINGPQIMILGSIDGL